MTRFEGDPELVTLAEAKAWLREHVDEGAECPCCTQFAKVYERRIHASMAAALIHVFRAASDQWCPIADILPHRQIADAAKLRYWNMLEPQEGVRDDGSKRVGIWRVTPSGVDWVRNRSTVPTYARVYDGRCLSLTGDPVTIIDALGTKFDYRELMGL